MYKTFLCGCLAFWMSIHAVSVSAQTKASRWAGGIGVNVLQYQPKRNTGGFQYSFYDVGIHLSGTRYLAGAFDFHTSFSYAPRVHFPTSIETFRETSLIDMNYQLRFKINNGVFLREDARIAPYLAFGVGGSYTKDNPDAYVPLGGGIRFKLTNRASISAQSLRKFSLNKDYQNVEHLISFVYNLRKEEISIPPTGVPSELSEEQGLAMMIPEDMDHDGIPNVQDQCPDVFGNQANHGCPDENLDMLEEESIKISTDFGLEQNESSVVFDEEEKNQLKDLLLEDAKAKDLASLEEKDSKEEPSVHAPCNHHAFETLPYVYFENGSDILSQSAKSALDEIALVLDKCENMRLIVQGHTDATGTENRNLLLSVMRAYKVKYYLVYDKGISQTRISSSGLGEQAPIASNQTNQGRGQNRRVDFKLAF